MKSDTIYLAVQSHDVCRHWNFNPQPNIISLITTILDLQYENIYSNINTDNEISCIKTVVNVRGWPTESLYPAAVNISKGVWFRNLCTNIGLSCSHSIFWPCSFLLWYSAGKFPMTVDLWTTKLFDTNNCRMILNQPVVLFKALWLEFKALDKVKWMRRNEARSNKRKSTVSAVTQITRVQYCWAFEELTGYIFLLMDYMITKCEEKRCKVCKILGSISS